LVRFDFADGKQESRRLTPNNPEFVVPATPQPWAVARTYLVLGFEHIVSGFDHLLFVLALVLLVRGMRRTIETITAFTVAHSLTLAAATLGWVRLSGPPIEATIALSIVFIAAEIRRSQKGERGWTERHPWVVAFSFGLLHGFGFAGALLELGLPQKSIPLALLLFNVGVELGQLAFVLAIGVLVAGSARLMRSLQWQWPDWTRGVPPYAIGITAAYWVVQRVFVG
jgi:hydrogenase/urease accessory protein HupE